MLEVPVVAVKDKQAFSLKKGRRYLGGAVEVCKRLAGRYKLIHIIDEDALRGLNVNFDVYDKLTYSVHIEVEVFPDVGFLKKLVSIHARVVVEPSALPSNAAVDKRFFVAKISKRDKVPEAFRDILVVDLEREEEVERFKGKRILAFNPLPGVWAHLFLI